MHLFWAFFGPSAYTRSVSPDALRALGLVLCCECISPSVNPRISYFNARVFIPQLEDSVEAREGGLADTALGLCAYESFPSKRERLTSFLLF